MHVNIWMMHVHPWASTVAEWNHYLGTMAYGHRGWKLQAHGTTWMTRIDVTKNASLKTRTCSVESASTTASIFTKAPEAATGPDRTNHTRCRPAIWPYSWSRCVSPCIILQCCVSLYCSEHWLHSARYPKLYAGYSSNRHCVNHTALLPTIFTLVKNPGLWIHSITLNSRFVPGVSIHSGHRMSFCCTPSPNFWSTIPKSAGIF